MTVAELIKKLESFPNKEMPVMIGMVTMHGSYIGDADEIKVELNEGEEVLVIE